MPYSATTLFRVRFFRTLISVWAKKIAIRYWCRECGRKADDFVRYGDSYPQFLCPSCGAKNVVDMKYR